MCDYDKYSYTVNRQKNVLVVFRYDVIDLENVNKSLDAHFQTLLRQIADFFYLRQHSNGFDCNEIQTTSSLL